MNRRRETDNKTGFENSCTIKDSEKVEVFDKQQFSFLENLPQGFILIQQEDFKPLLGNYYITGLIGIPIDQLLKISGEDFIELFYQEDREGLKNRVQGDYPQTPEEYRLIDKDGNTIWLNISMTRVSYQEISSVLLLLVDITEVKSTEKSFIETRNLLEVAISQSSSGIIIADAPDIHIKVVNQAALDVRGGDPEKLKNLQISEQVAGWQLSRPDGSDIKPEDLPLSRSILNGEVINNEEIIVKNEDGIDHWCSLNASPIKSPAGDIFAGILIFNDITESKKVQKELRSSKKFVENLVETANALIVTLDTNASINIFNRYAEEVTGYKKPEVTGKNWFKMFIPPKDKHKIPALFRDTLEFMPETSHYENPILTKEGEEKIIRWSNSIIRDTSGKIDGVLCIGTDITEHKRAKDEKKNLEARLRRSQKLETIGTLAGGIAHDFNNILTPILGYTDLLLFTLEKGDPIHTYMTHILKGSQRARKLIEQILLFSKLTHKEKQSLDLKSLILEALKLLRPSIPTTIEIQKDISSPCSRVYADPTQIHQVIINLCTNAWQAMEKGGGILKIELQEVKLNSSKTRKGLHLDDGNYARLSITDTGVGMEEKVLERVFEPFYTTKTVNKGTGLGLSVVHGIIDSHNGDIQVVSEPGKGTTFNVYLPVSNENRDEETVEDKKVPEGSEYIMVVDDETDIGEMVKIMLKQFGYNSEVHDSGSKAFDAFEKDPGKYDLLVSDLTMPKMTGLELANKIHHISPDLPVIIMTGFGDSLTEETMEESGIDMVIGKPVPLKLLGSKIRQVLDNRKK